MDLQDLISRLALAFGIGLLIGLERGWRRRKGTAGSRAAGIRTFTIAAVLAMREPIHDWVERITWPEFQSTLVLLAMTFIVLPIVQEDPVGPFGGVNLREVWIVAIVLGAVSFVGYAAVKYFGASRGELLSGP